jgi:lipopolysaccharide transport system ATP-binding protein
MSNTVISVENLSKAYRLGQIGTGTLSHDLNVWWAKMRGKPNPLLKIGQTDHGNRDGEEIWALKGVSFTVDRGEVLGIIGRNGAGKSTLLKILSRVTAPTSGKIKVKGRVASLLEVGTGFHPDLTGRENIYLNGAILGMTRKEIDRKFDEIVDFAEIEQFIDTPIKRYSSGMYVRLAFAVAAHLEPEILLVDEVLAVGDAEFQKKCLGKMSNIAGEGRTVLFVSHNMAAIQNLCETTILLEKGKISLQGATQQVVQSYFRTQDGDNFGTGDLQFHKGRRPGSNTVLRKLRIFADDHEGTNICMGGNLRINVSFEHKSPISNIRFGIAVEDATGQRLLNFSPTLQAPDLVKVPVSKGSFDCYIPQLHLLSGIYYLTLIIGNGTSDLDRIDRAGQFSVEAADVFGTGFPPQPGHGIYYQDVKWSYISD